jgi:hypothetical protein
MNKAEPQIRVTNFRPFAKGTLIAFFDVELPSGLILRDCSFHEKNGGRWVDPPSTKFAGQDGKPVYKRLVDFATRGLGDEFRDAVLAAIEAAKLLPPPPIQTSPPAQKTNASGPPRAEIPDPDWLKP